MSTTSDRFEPDAPTYVVRPMRESELTDEREHARAFWRESPTNLYYRQFQPQALLLVHLLRSIGATSVLELGCNVGRNLYWIKRSVPGIRVSGLDVNPDAVAAGRDFFEFSENELWVADDSSLAHVPTDAFDAVFTVSVLDHLPEVEDTLRQMLRIARLRVMLIELVLPRFGRIDDPRCIDCSYSHDYAAIFGRLPCELLTHAPAPLGEGILEHYQLYEARPTPATSPRSRLAKATARVRRWS
jgi:SAM-dependent methyltransferase